MPKFSNFSYIEKRAHKREEVIIYKQSLLLLLQTQQLTDSCSNHAVHNRVLVSMHSRTAHHALVQMGAARQLYRKVCGNTTAISMSSTTPAKYVGEPLAIT